jgi:hypothetical protein
MVMDRDKGGVAGQLAVWGIATTIFLAAFGGVYSLAQSMSEVNAKLDRNCRILVQLDQDIRLHVLSEGQRDLPPGVRRGTLDVFPNVSC